MKRVIAAEVWSWPAFRSLMRAQIYRYFVCLLELIRFSQMPRVFENRKLDHKGSNKGKETSHVGRGCPSLRVCQPRKTDKVHDTGEIHQDQT